MWQRKRRSRRSLRGHRGTSGVFSRTTRSAGGRGRTCRGGAGPGGSTHPPSAPATGASHSSAEEQEHRGHSLAPRCIARRTPRHAGCCANAPRILTKPTLCPTHPTPTAGALRRHQDNPTWISAAPHPGPYLTAVAALMKAASQALDLVGVLVLTGDDGELAGTAHRGVFPWWDKKRGDVSPRGRQGQAESPHPGLLSYL